MDDFGIVTYAAITAICFLVGLGVKVSKLNSKYIPIIVGACGAGLGIAGFFGIPDFAETPLDAIARGIVSGLAATGVNELFTQLGKDDDSKQDDEA